MRVGTVTGMSNELADMMERRKVDCVCRKPGGREAMLGALKLFWHGVDKKKSCKE